MNSARSALSPTKENQIPFEKNSPSKKDKSQLNEIISYLKQNGIKLPSYLLSNKNPQEFSLKLNAVQNNSKGTSQVKSLRIKLTDTQFQLKKIEEDFAQYKRSVKIQKDKQQKRFEEALQRLKSDSKQNNEDYDFAKQKQVKKHSQQVQKLRNEYTSKLQKLQKQLTLKHSQQINKLKHKSASQLQSQQVEHNKKYNSLHKQLTQEIQTLKKDFQRQKHNINLRNKEKLQENLRKYQSTYIALQSQKKTEEKLHQKTKIDSQREKQKLFGQLCYQRNVKKNLEDQLSARNKEIKQLKSTINELNIKLEIQKQNSVNQKQWMKNQHQREIAHIHEQYQDKIHKLLETHTQACEKYQNKIQKINYLHEQSQRLAEQKLQHLSSKFQQRLSKQQDIDEIKSLTQTIVKRDQQIKKLTRQLRYRNLQIENKQEVYNKIFKSSTRMREQKKLASINKCEYPIPKLERESWSKESLFRKNQTTDVKLILKNMNKTKRQKANSLKQE